MNTPEIVALDAEIARLDAERQKIFDQVRPLNAESLRLYEARKILVEQASALKTAEILMSGERDWPKLLDGKDDTLYTAFDQIIQSYKCVYPHGCYVQNQQRALQLKFCRENIEELQIAHDLIKTLLPHYTVATEDNYLPIGIFEHTCSEHASYRLEINKDNPDISRLCAMQYHRDSVLKEFTSLIEALSYVQQNHYYESNQPRHEEDEYDL